MPQENELSLELRDIERQPEAGNVENLRLLTDQETIVCRHHKSDAGDAAILFVFGAGGGLGGPAGGIYERLARHFQSKGVASLQLDYRRAGRLPDSVLDVLLGIEFLGNAGKNRVALVGHSFGGAVVITAGAISERVFAVAALSSQTNGALDAAGELAPKPLLLIHGTADEILPDSCSRRIYERAREPKELILYDGCKHGLDDCRTELDLDLNRWLEQVLRSESVIVERLL